MRFLLSIALLVLLCSSALAEAKRPPIKDEAKLFHPATIEKANREIARIRDEFNIDLCIDTFTKLPGKADEELHSLKSTHEKNLFFNRFAEERAEAEGVDGIYVLVTTDPRNVVLIGYPDRREKESIPIEEKGGLSRTKRENKLRKPFATALGDDPDRALLDLIAHFRQAVNSLKTPPPSPISTLQALALVAGVIGLWVLLSLLRLTVASRQAKASGEPFHRLYQPATLGSLFGAPSGFQIYDRLFIREPPPAPSSPSTPAPVVKESAPIVEPPANLPEIKEMIPDPPPSEEQP